MEYKIQGLKELLEQFSIRAHDPESAAKAWKEKTGGKVIGVTGLDMPEPLFHAAGLLPIVLLDRDEEVTLANEHVEMHQCGYIRSLIDQALKGEIAYCDELFFHDCCHIVRMLGDAMHNFSDIIPKVQFCYFSPMLEYETSREQVRTEMGKLKARIEKVARREITDQALANSVKLFNEQKRLWMELYDLRRSHPGLIRAVDVSNVVASGMSMPREDHVEMLKALIPLLKQEMEVKPVSRKKRIVVHGSLCERCDDYVLETIENEGGVIVDDDLYVGSKYFSTLYDEGLPPMEAVQKAYWERVSPCPTRFEERNPGEFLEKMIKNAKAEGIVMVIVKFCEAHDYYYFTAHRYFEKAGIPEILVETEHDSMPVGQLTTRIQAFYESMEV